MTVIGVYIQAGFGNRLFKLAFGYAFTKKEGYLLRFENWDKPSHHSSDVYAWLLERFFKLDHYCATPVQYHTTIHEPGELCMTYMDFSGAVAGNTFILGFFQQEMYFKHVRSDLLHLFRAPEDVAQYLTTHLPFLTDSYFIHIRIGDYWGDPKHWVNLEQYYINAMEQLPAESKFCLFCEDHHNIPKAYPRLYRYMTERNVRLVPEKNEVVAFYAMVACGRGGICANSTYSWWAAWLNNCSDKKVFMPEKWMGGIRKCDIYFDGCIKVAV